MSSEIFRFLTVRQPQRTSQGEIERISVRAFDPADPTFLHRELAELRVTGAPRAAFITRARQFRESNDFVSGAALLRAIDELEAWLSGQTRPIEAAAVEQVILELFRAPLDAVMASDAYRDTRARVSDSLIAVTIAPEGDDRVRARLVELMRVFALLEHLARGPEAPGLVEQSLRAIVLLPSDVFPLPEAVDPHAEERRAAHQVELERYEEARKATANILEQIETARGAIEEIEAAYFADNLDFRREQHERRELEPRASEPRPPDLTTSDEARRAAARPVGWTVVEVGASVRPTALSSARAEDLSGKTKALLARFGAADSFVDVPQAVERLAQHVRDLSTRLDRGTAATVMTLVGNQFVPRPARWRALEMQAVCDHEPPDAPTPTGPTVPEGAGYGRLVGVADLLIVRQEIQRYVAGQVAHIENVMTGETRERTHRRSRRVEEVITIEREEVEETSRDLQTAERFELQQESSEVIREETSTEAGLTVTAAYGPWLEVTANVNYAKDTAREEAARKATSYSREVTERAVRRIQERVFEARARTTIEEFEEINRHAFDNAGTSGHVRGIYRWVDKFYSAQVVSYGLRSILEFVVPEPAAFYKHALSTSPREGMRLERPEPPGTCDETGAFTPLTPSDLDEANYLDWTGKYAAAGVNPPPPRYQLVGIPFRQTVMDAPWGVVAEASDQLEVPDGYAALRAWMQGAYMTTLPDSWLAAYIGRSRLPLWQSVGLSSEEGPIPIALFGWGVPAYAITIQVLCQRTAKHLQRWQMETYQAIMDAYRDQRAAYEAELARLEVQGGVRITGRNPLRNREIERTELTRAVLSQYTGQHFDDFDAMRRSVPPHGYPQMDLAEARAEGPYIQFFEQAFEWMHMTYVFYPYFWGRKDNWPEALSLDDNDPIFASFLRAGAARVQVPVRPGYEEAVLHFLETNGSIWRGGDPPHIDDPFYVSIIDEVRAEQGADFRDGVGTVSVAAGEVIVTGTGTAFDADLHTEREIMIAGVENRVAEVISETELRLATPHRGASVTDVTYRFGARFVGDPWEVSVPTALVYLQPGEDLPDFTTDAET